MKIVHDIDEMRALSGRARASGGSVVLVPTMGYLHRGHRELLRLAFASGGFVVLSIFVNPAQFGVNEDFDKYPRDLARDIDTAREEGVEVVFAPTAEAMYPEGYNTFVTVEALGENLCGASRPGHFRGVTTVVAKLFNIVGPDKAVFGKKDFQQLKIIEKMTSDLDLGVEIIPAPTVREPDGLALSSRNAYLSPEERKAAGAVPRALGRADEAYRGGLTDCRELIDAATGVLASEGLVEIEYVNVVDPATLKDVERVAGPAVMALAVRIGRARLIDNLELCSGEV